MKTLFESEAVKEILERMDTLKSSSERRWGTMEVAQMLAHCSSVLTLAKGEKFPPRVFIGRIIGPFFKSNYSNEKPFPQSSPTSKSAIISDERDFEKEKVILQGHIHQFSVGGEAKCTTYPHPFFGKLTPKEWGIGMYKHLDHHLRQFGV